MYKDQKSSIQQLPFLIFIFCCAASNALLHELFSQKFFDKWRTLFGHSRHKRHVSAFLIARIIHDKVISHRAFRITVIGIYKAFADRGLYNPFFHLCRKCIQKFHIFWKPLGINPQFDPCFSANKGCQCFFALFQKIGDGKSAFRCFDFTPAAAVHKKIVDFFNLSPAWACNF